MKRPNKEITFRPELHYDSNPAILREFSKQAIKCVVENREGFLLPEPFSTLVIEGRKKRAVDFKATKKYNKVIYHTNMNTDGYAFNVKYYHNREGYNKRLKSVLMYIFKFKSYKLIKYAIKEAIDKGNWRNWIRKKR